MNRQTLILSCVLVLCLMLGMLFIRQRDETLKREAAEAVERKAKEEAFIARAVQDYRDKLASEDAEYKRKRDEIKLNAAIAKMRIDAQLGR